MPEWTGRPWRPSADVVTDGVIGAAIGAAVGAVCRRETLMFPHTDRIRQGQLDPGTHASYCQALVALSEATVPFLVGGGYALERYTGIARPTKDLDLFVRRRDCPRVLSVLSTAGFRTELTFPHWLAKAFRGEDYVDIIFSSGNALAEVDDAWFEHAVPDVVLGVPVKLSPPEEMIWSKAFIMERERYDGADVAHLFHTQGRELDWPRLLDRFATRWRVLLSHLTLFGFIYPRERARIPDWVMRTLLDRLRDETRRPPPDDWLCQGTILSRAQYLPDIARRGYRDARRRPIGNMSTQDISDWTAAIEREGKA